MEIYNLLMAGELHADGFDSYNGLITDGVCCTRPLRRQSLTGVAPRHGSYCWPAFLETLAPHQLVAVCCWWQVAVQSFKIGWNFTDGERVATAQDVTALGPTPVTATVLTAPQVRLLHQLVVHVCNELSMWATNYHSSQRPVGKLRVPLRCCGVEPHPLWQVFHVPPGGTGRLWRHCWDD